MSATVSMISDLARSVAAGQNLINNFRPEPPKVQFYNIRLGLSSSLNNSDSFPSVITTDIADTQFFAKFEEVNSALTKPRRSYQDISMSFLGARGSNQKRTDISDAGEVAVQTTPPSNGFSLKSVDLKAGSESLCISNIVIKGSNAQSPREEIFVPIGDLGFLCGRKWNWGSVLDGNRQRCIWLEGQSDKSGKSKELLHLDIERMAEIFKADKDNELKRTDLNTACTYLGNSKETDVLKSRYSTSSSVNSELKDNIEEEINLQQIISDSDNEILVGEMRTEDLFAKKHVAVDQQDISDIIDGPETTVENLITTEDILEVEQALAEEELQMNEEISGAILEEAESQAEENLFSHQMLEKEKLLEDEMLAEELVAQQSGNLSPEEMLAVKLNLVENELNAEEALAEKSLEEEEFLAREELIAEENLAQEMLTEQEIIAEEGLIAEEVLAEERLAENFDIDTPNEEKLQAETELLKAEIAAEEDLLLREESAEEALDENILRAEQKLVEDEINAEEELEVEKMMQRELLSDQIVNEEAFTNPVYSDQQSQESEKEWLEEQEISRDFMDDDFFPEDMTEEEFASLPNYSEIMEEEIYDENLFQIASQDWLDDQEITSEELDKERSFVDGMKREVSDDSTTDNVKKEQSSAEGVAGISELKKRQAFTV